MNKQILISMIAIAFAAVPGSTPAAAQNRHTATIPFSFEAGGVEYPEGAYAVDTITGAKVIKLTNLTTGHAAVVLAPVLSGDKPPTNPELIFTVTSHGMRLREVWLRDIPGMVLVSKGRQEVSAKAVIRIN